MVASGAEPDAERPTALRIRVALPQSRTNPKGRHWRTPLDAPGVSSGVGASQVPPTVLVEPCSKKPGPKGPSEALIQAILELKSRNPRFGCPRIARIISHTFGVDIDRNVVYRVLSKHYHPAPGGTGPSWLSFIGHTTDSLWSVDLFRCESIVLRSYWVLVVMDQFTRRLVGVGVHRGAGQERRPLPHVQRRHSWSGHTATSQYRSRSTVRRAPLDGEPSDYRDRRNQDRASCAPVTPIRGAPDRDDAARILDHVLFWNACDLERKLADFQSYYNAARSHASLEGHTPLTFAGGHTVARAELTNVRWVSHCRDLVQLPVAA